MENTPAQLPLNFLTRYDGPEWLPLDTVAQARTYRQACQGAWQHRKRRNLTFIVLASETGSYASHCSEYFSDNTAKRELPAKYINAVEISLGNRFITQWLNMQAGAHVLEELAHRRAA